MAVAKRTAAELATMIGPWHDGAPTADALASAIAEVIDAGLVPAGTTLPSQRDLARQLGIARGTVSSCYSRLTEQGRLLTREGSGSRVRTRLSAPGADVTGRLFSFSDASQRRIDLSTGALPASGVAREVIERTSLTRLDHYLETDGYFPAGLPVLRVAIAELLTRDGVATSPDQILVTNGAQHATALTLSTYLTSGDEVVAEEPTYRGVLELLRTRGARIRSVPVGPHGIDVDLLSRSLTHSPTLVHVQTGIHNPTGWSTEPPHRRRLASALASWGGTVVEDCCSRDLTGDGRPVPTLAGLLPDDQLISIGTLSKLYWGGLRVGWLRTSRHRVRALLESRKTTDLSSPIIDQVLAVHLLDSVDEARAERASTLTVSFDRAEDLLHEICPRWIWTRPRGGTALWVDVGTDAVSLAERARAAGVVLAPGPTFSAHGGMTGHLRLPVVHDPEVLRHALTTVRTLVQRPDR